MVTTVDLTDVPRELRARIAAAVRERRQTLSHDIAMILVNSAELDPTDWQTFGRVMVDLLALAIEERHIDDRRGPVYDLAHISPQLSLRQTIAAIYRGEPAVLDELARHRDLGPTSDAWPMVAHAVRTATIEVITAVAQRVQGQLVLRDTLTTLLSAPVFDLVLQQEALRARRHHHGVSMILFDVDSLAEVNRAHGFGAGDRLLERLGILARQFFRTHDWVARYGEDSIAVLLPETTVDQATVLATRFCETVHQRLVLVEHKTDERTAITVSAAAVGTDAVREEIDPRDVLSAAQAALLRAKSDGGNRVERVRLPPGRSDNAGAGLPPSP